MLSAIIKWAIARRWLVILGAIVITFWIFRTIIQMPLDVFPSFAPPLLINGESVLQYSPDGGTDGGNLRRFYSLGKLTLYLLQSLCYQLTSLIDVASPVKNDFDNGNSRRA